MGVKKRARSSSQRRSSRGIVEEADAEVADNAAGAAGKTTAEELADALTKAKVAALAALGGVLLDVDGPVEGDAPANGSSSAVPKSRRDRPPADDDEAKEDRGAGDAGEADDSAADDAEVDYVPAELEVPNEYGDLADVMARFSASGQPDVEEKAEAEAGDAERAPAAPGDAGARRGEGDEPSDAGVGGDADRVESARSGEAEDAAGAATALSERQLRKRRRPSIAQVKALVRDPAVVEQWDVTASDPLLLVHLKAVHGSVPVPENWRQKRKYLQSKRGMEKLPFKMPSYIEDTGVCAARAALAEADASKTAKQKGRERIRPKASGKGVDVDYSVLRDAFFKFQTKPRLTGHGDLYYEMREREVQHEGFRPGAMSATLREALGVGPNDPPPWLVAMQRYGPPPSYPGLEIPGLNAPIPVGASFGYHAGGWGKPPVDEFGRPLHGDVFGEGTRYGEQDSRFDLPVAERERLWGEPRAAGAFGDEEEDAGAAAAARKRHAYHEDEEAEAAEGAAEEKLTGEAEEKESKRAAADVEEGGAAGDAAGLPGTLSVAPGMETPAAGIELRKGLAPGQLFTVLEQRQVSVGKSGILGSSHAYDIGGGDAGETAAGGASGAAGDGAGSTTAADARVDAPLSKRKRSDTEDKQEARDAKAAREATRSKAFKF
jgi:splicing factor 3B subunit 2